MSITERAMLTRLSIGQWSAKKLDKKITKEVADQHNTTTDAGQYRKTLIAKDAMDRIAKAHSAARTFNYEQTLPWLDDGARILPAANFNEYSAGIRKLKADYERAVSDFLDNYESYVENARYTLNGLFNADDYPTPTQLAKKFYFKHGIDPMPGPEDFRVLLSNEETDAIRREIENRQQEATNAAMRDLWRRVKDVVSAMVERLSDPENTFKNSLVENARELAEILPRLNITNDAALETARREIAGKLCKYTPETLRSSKIARETTAAEAQAILDRMAAYTG